MDFEVSGPALAQWRSTAQKSAIALGLNAREVDWFIQRCTELDKLSLHLGTFRQRERIASAGSLAALNKLWQRRLVESCPLQYLVGVAPWRHFVLKVSPSVLIPRPETELLIDLIWEQINDAPELGKGNWVDLGTGSGAIALGLAEVLPEAQIHAVDQSAEALEIARSNAQKYNYGDRIQFYQGSWWQPLEKIQGKIQGMISNPPYIPSSDLATLPPEVYRHEPHLALDGGDDGLDAIRYLINTATDYLQSGGIWAIEVMVGQAPLVKNLLEQQGNYKNIQIYQDLAGIERFVLAFRA